MIDSKDFRMNKITVYSGSGEVISEYEGKSYLFFGDKEKDGFHYIDGNNKHHRIYGGCVIVDEI